MSWDTTNHNLYWSSFSEAEKTIKKYARNGETMKLFNNTTARLDPHTKRVAVTLHWTDIYQIEYRHNVGDEFPHSIITLHSGGHRTPTTKRRINQMLPIGYQVIQRDFNWILQKKETMWGGMNQDKWYDQELFYDGMQIRTMFA